MPAKKCENGKWKWGESGSCVYDSKKEAQDANSDYRDERDVNLDVTEGMKEEAARGKAWREEFGRGGTEVGLKTANMILSNSMTEDRVKKMYAYFERHETYKDAEGFRPGEKGYPSNSRIAHSLWGGDAGHSWSEKKRNQLKKEEKNLRKKVGSMITDGVEMPLFDSSKEAEQEAEKLGGSGFHEHTLDGETVYMPFKSHEEIMDVMNNRTIKNNTMEKRIFNVETRVDTTEDGKDVVVGYASVYDSRSNNLGGFYEYIERGAFTDELIEKSDVRALINHDASKIMARSKNGLGTLNLKADEKGLRYQFEIDPELSYAKDLAISLKRGDISQSSFAFTIAPNGDEWSTDADGNNIRTIKKFDQIFDISSVTFPAYSQAESDLVVAQRGLEAYKQSLVEETKEEIIEEKENNLVRGSLISLNIELKKRK